jgi:hypothetical protein
MRNYSSVVKADSVQVEPSLNEWYTAEFDEVTGLLSVVHDFYLLPLTEQPVRLQEWQALYASETDTEVGEFIRFFSDMLSSGDLSKDDAHQTLQDLLDTTELPFELVEVITKELVADWWSN